MTTGNAGVPVEQLQALVRLLFPDEMTPTAKRMIESVCDLHTPVEAGSVVNEEDR